MQPGDVADTYASVDILNEKFNYRPSTPVVEGVFNFIKWYREFYNKWKIKINWK